jgi:4-hydroxybenzoate polyprenyltransferase
MLTYAQLVRLPNVPSALADIALAALAVGALPGRWLPFLGLALTSACLYMAGMAFNDYFDVEEDRRERPERPIPSGRVSRSEAGYLGMGLLFLGVAFAVGTALLLASRGDTPHPWKPVWVTGFLIVSIFLYDGWLKRTDLGPLSMGACRFFNVLLGLSILGTNTTFPHLHLAFVVGLYIVGVTWFAKTEARVSERASLRGAAAVILASLVLSLALPAPHRAGTASPLFPFLLVGFGFFLGLALWEAIERPEPGPVQTAVKRCLMGLIVFDAILASALGGSLGLAVLILLIPSLWLNRRRRLYAT